MTRLSCPTCRLRLTVAAAATLTNCPECERDLELATSAAALLGYRLFDVLDAPPALPMAAEAALPTHDPRSDDA